MSLRSNGHMWIQLPTATVVSSPGRMMGVARKCTAVIGRCLRSGLSTETKFWVLALCGLEALSKSIFCFSLSVAHLPHSCMCKESNEICAFGSCKCVLEFFKHCMNTYHVLTTTALEMHT